MHLKGVRRRPVVRSPAPGRLATHVVEVGAHLGTSSLGAGDQSPQGVRPQWWQSGDWVADPELRPVRDISSILSVRKCQPTDGACAGGNGVRSQAPVGCGPASQGAPPPRKCSQPPAGAGSPQARSLAQKHLPESWHPDGSRGRQECLSLSPVPVRTCAGPCRGL